MTHETRPIHLFRPTRGKTRLFHYKDILEAKNFKPFADTFFCILTYNPEARRMADTHGEIRLGASHQAELPACHATAAEQSCGDSEALLWDCTAIADTNLFAYLQAARSVAAFAGMCERGSQEDMLEAVQSDATTIQALSVLNDASYNTSRAIRQLVKRQTPKGLCRVDQKWCDEDQVSFSGDFEGSLQG
jgi:arginine-glutamic acid dipeptide repeat-containing protein